MAALGRCGRGLDGAVGDLHLVEARPTGELLYRRAVEVAGRKIHLREVAALGQHGVDQRHAFEDDRPVDIGDVPHARYDVANRDIGRDLPLLFVVDRAVGRPFLRRQPFVEPAEHIGEDRALIPQPVNELDHERVGRRRRPELVDEVVFRLSGTAAAAEQMIGDRIGLPALVAAVDDTLGDPPQILDQDDAQGDRRGP